MNGNNIDISSGAHDQPHTILDHPNVKVIAETSPQHEPMLHIASPPHSINIQINIPNKDDDVSKEAKTKENIDFDHHHHHTHGPQDDFHGISHEGTGLLIIPEPNELQMPRMLPPHGDSNYHQMPHMLPPHDDLDPTMPHMLPPHEDWKPRHPDPNSFDPLSPIPGEGSFPGYNPKDAREHVAAIAASLPSKHNSHLSPDFPGKQYVAHTTRLPPMQYHPTRHVLPPKQYFPTSIPQTDENSPHQEYVGTKTKMGPKEYLSTNEYEKPDYNTLELKDFPPKEYIPTKTDDLNSDVPIALHYLPPSSDFKPPKEYLPTIPANGNIDESGLPDPPRPDLIPTLPDVEGSVEDFILNLETPSRGPQSPIPEELKSAKYRAPDLKSPKYVPPPRRPVSVLKLEGSNVPNSQVNTVKGSKEYYIPPRTENDVPKNFRRPGDVEIEVDEPPPPEIIPNLDDIESFERAPFLGLAKFTKSEDEKQSQIEEDRQPGGNKLEKLIQRPEPGIPPMPTVPPQPDTFLPLLESINPSLLQQLRQGILGQKSSTKFTTGGGSAGQGRIPGVPGKDYPDFKTIPNTEFSCENFILEGFYADTFTSCQVTHWNKNTSLFNE